MMINPLHLSAHAPGISMLRSLVWFAQQGPEDGIYADYNSGMSEFSELITELCD
jgi:hypothetical protein